MQSGTQDNSLSAESEVGSGKMRLGGEPGPSSTSLRGHGQEGDSVLRAQGASEGLSANEKLARFIFQIKCL